MTPRNIQAGSAGSFGEKASSTGRTELPCFHSTPCTCLVPAAFPSGSHPAPPGELSIELSSCVRWGSAEKKFCRLPELHTL